MHWDNFPFTSRPLVCCCSALWFTIWNRHIIINVETVVCVQEKSACVLIDLCAGPLAPWLAMIIAKVTHFLKRISFAFKEFEKKNSAIYVTQICNHAWCLEVLLSKHGVLISHILLGPGWLGHWAPRRSIGHHPGSNLRHFWIHPWIYRYLMLIYDPFWSLQTTMFTLFMNFLHIGPVWLRFVCVVYHSATIYWELLSTWVGNLSIISISCCTGRSAGTNASSCSSGVHVVGSFWACGWCSPTIQGTFNYSVHFTWSRGWHGHMSMLGKMFSGFHVFSSDDMWMMMDSQYWSLNWSILCW